jgi:hypothetical protein
MGGPPWLWSHSDAAHVLYLARADATLCSFSGRRNHGLVRCPWSGRRNAALSDSREPSVALMALLRPGALS